MENGLIYSHPPTHFYGNQMMHLVPSCSPLPSTFDVSQLEFDLDLLPSLPSLSDCVVPGSPYNSPPYSSLDTHTTMFSPEPKLGGKTTASAVYPPSPASSSLSSPYSPAGRADRRISTSSSLHEVDNSSINLQESLLEFTQLQDRIKQEQDMLLDSNSTGMSPLSLVGPPSTTSSSYPPSHRLSVSSEVFPLSPDCQDPDITHHSSQDVKMEPLDFLDVKSPRVTSSTTTTTGNVLLKQCLDDTSFMTKHNLKPFNFGVGVGFVTETSTSKTISSEPTTVQSLTPTPTVVKTEPGEIKPPTVGEHKPLALTLSDTVKIEPMLDLAADQVRRDIASTCQMLSISPNPREWSKEDVKSWLLWTFSQFSIPMSLLDLDMWNMDGMGLISMNENDFKQRLPNRHGENLFAQFDIWRTNYNYEEAGHVRGCSQESQYNPPPPPPYPDTYWSPPEQVSIPSSSGGGSDTFGDIAYMLQMLDHQQVGSGPSSTPYIIPKTEPGLSPPPYPHPQTPTTPIVAPPSTGSSDYGAENMEEDDEEEEEETEVGRKSPNARPGTNIHLWQFVKELLLQPQTYGNYIHWIDRQKGIFKIVDSVKVATLWGKRKNRPAMNYDKLSRSLRQYYKKGIMKKTERSQRLVYQFCHPYHL